MEQAPKRSLVSALSFLWTANCPSLLYGIKCGIVVLLSEQLVFVSFDGIDSLFVVSETTAKLAVYWGLIISIVAGVLRWFAKLFWSNFFVDLEEAIFWLYPLYTLAIVPVYILMALFGSTYKDPTMPIGILEMFGIEPPLIPAAVLAFIVARILRRATEVTPDPGETLRRLGWS